MHLRTTVTWREPPALEVSYTGRERDGVDVRVIEYGSDDSGVEFDELSDVAEGMGMDGGCIDCARA